MFNFFKRKLSKTIHLTDQTWDEEITDFKGVAIVDVWAIWCAPCKILGPIIDEIANEIKNEVKICKLNSEQHKKSHELGIRSIPTILIYKDGELVDKIVGLISKNDIVATIDSHL
jgi:thioredoxin 1